MKRQNLRTVSLIVVTFTYLLIGASIFGWFESDNEIRQRENLELLELIIRRKYNISEDDFTVLTTTIIKSVPHKAGIQWRFAGAFYFATTVVTTIGYGHSTPSTVGGRSFCMLYALIGIPLGLVMFQSIGERLNTFVGTALRHAKRCFKAKNPEVTQTNLVMVVLVLSTILMTSMAAVFAKYERWDYFDALYYCFITLTTIGFGDYVALQKESALQSKPEYVALSLIFILFGLSVVSSAVNLLVLKFLTLNTEDERRDEQMRCTAALNPIQLEGDVITSSAGKFKYLRTKRLNGDRNSDRDGDGNAGDAAAAAAGGCIENGGGTAASDDKCRHRARHLMGDKTSDNDYGTNCDSGELSLLSSSSSASASSSSSSSSLSKSSRYNRSRNNNTGKLFGIRSLSQSCCGNFVNNHESTTIPNNYSDCSGREILCACELQVAVRQHRKWCQHEQSAKQQQQQLLLALPPTSRFNRPSLSFAAQGADCKNSGDKNNRSVHNDDDHDQDQDDHHVEGNQPELNAIGGGGGGEGESCIKLNRNKSSSKCRAMVCASLSTNNWCHLCQNCNQSNNNEPERTSSSEQVAPQVHRVSQSLRQFSSERYCCCCRNWHGKHPPPPASATNCPSRTSHSHAFQKLQPQLQQSQLDQATGDTSDKLKRHCGDKAQQQQQQPPLLQLPPPTATTFLNRTNLNQFFTSDLVEESDQQISIPSCTPQARIVTSSKCCTGSELAQTTAGASLSSAASLKEQPRQQQQQQQLVAFEDPGQAHKSVAAAAAAAAAVRLCASANYRNHHRGRYSRSDGTHDENSATALNHNQCSHLDHKLSFRQQSNDHNNCHEQHQQQPPQDDSPAAAAAAAASTPRSLMNAAVFTSAIMTTTSFSETQRSSLKRGRQPQQQQQQQPVVSLSQRRGQPQLYTKSTCSCSWISLHHNQQPIDITNPPLLKAAALPVPPEITPTPLSASSVAVPAQQQQQHHHLQTSVLTARHQRKLQPHKTGSMFQSTPTVNDEDSSEGGGCDGDGACKLSEELAVVQHNCFRSIERFTTPDNSDNGIDNEDIGKANDDDDGCDNESSASATSTLCGNISMSRQDDYTDDEDLDDASNETPVMTTSTASANQADSMMRKRQQHVRRSQQGANEKQQRQHRSASKSSGDLSGNPIGGFNWAAASSSNSTVPKLVCKCCCQHDECIQYALKSDQISENNPSTTGKQLGVASGIEDNPELARDCLQIDARLRSVTKEKESSIGYHETDGNEVDESATSEPR